MPNLKAVPKVMWIQHDLSEALLTGMMSLKASRSLHSPLGNLNFQIVISVSLASPILSKINLNLKTLALYNIPPFGGAYCCLVCVFFLAKMHIKTLKKTTFGSASLNK